MLVLILCLLILVIRNTKLKLKFSVKQVKCQVVSSVKCERYTISHVTNIAIRIMSMREKNKEQRSKIKTRWLAIHPRSEIRGPANVLYNIYICMYVCQKCKLKLMLMHVVLWCRYYASLFYSNSY